MAVPKSSIAAGSGTWVRVCDAVTVTDVFAANVRKISWLREKEPTRDGIRVCPVELALLPVAEIVSGVGDPQTPVGAVKPLPESTQAW